MAHAEDDIGRVDSTSMTCLCAPSYDNWCVSWLDLAKNIYFELCLEGGGGLKYPLKIII